MGRTVLSLVCNAVIACWTLVAVWQTARRNQNETGDRTAAFRYFTTDSNLLAGAAALLVAVCDAQLLLAGGGQLPAWAVLCKYVGTVAVTVTFLTVIVFLGPSAGYREMFAAEGLFLHLIGPLLAVLSLCALDAGAPIPLGWTLLGMLPTLLYGVLYLVMVVIVGERRGGWTDFYGFNKNGKWPLSMAVMLAATYGICALLRWLHNSI